MKTVDIYKEIKVFEFPGMIARVHIPDLSPEERSARMKDIQNATINLFKK